jgi:transcriptional regulator with XRE-family HTH domain
MSSMKKVRNICSLRFGRMIREEREARGISQKAMALSIRKDNGVLMTQSYLNDIEHGRRGPCSDVMLEQMALYLGIQTDYLYYIAGRLPPDIVLMNIDAEHIEVIIGLLRFPQRLEGMRA